MNKLNETFIRVKTLFIPRYKLRINNHQMIILFELLFQIPTSSVDIGGSWGGKPEILENA